MNMKKVLIASTALVAATMVSAGAASASEKIKLDLGGYSKWFVVGAWQKGSFQRASNLQPVAVDIKGDNEVFFGGETTLNNGLKVGINIELEAGGNVDTRANAANPQNTDVIDKSSVFVEGGFGKVIIGTEANGAVLLHVMAPDAAGNWGSDGILTGGNAIAAPAWASGAIGLRTTTEIDTDDNAEKITYVSPSFYGFTVGGSYIPNALSEDNRGVEGGSTNNQLNTTTGAVPAYGVGALYANTFGDFGVKASAGFVWYDLTRAGKAGNADLGYHGEANHEWSVGTQLSYKGVTLGGSYRNISDEVTAAAGRNSFDGHVWDAGVSYASGPYAVSFSYLQSQYEGSTTIAKDDKEEVYQASGKYALGPGVDALASAGYVKYTGETAAADQNNKGWVVMSGLSLAF
jgi:hypothetical protein